MENDDEESKNMDTWNILGQQLKDNKKGQQIKDSVLSNSLKHSSDDIYTNEIEEEKQLLHYGSIVGRDSTGKNTIKEPKFAFKGFKKRILAQAREIHSAVSEQQKLMRSNALGKNGKNKRTDGKGERKIMEYAQYLGLQPSSKPSRCSKCRGWSNCSPTVTRNPCNCNSSTTSTPSTSESASLPYNNFKITRKVYLCSACGTYFENWNLFLHMRDIHKRHICLFCLGMFGQAERLLYHLSKKHSVPEMTFDSVEDFYGTFKGSCYLVCCSCERIFSETENFYSHFCSPTLKQDATDGMSVCTLCRQTGTHASTCNFTLSSDTDKELYSTTSPAMVATETSRADDAFAPLPERAINLGGKGLPRKMIKNNKRKCREEGIQNSHQQKSNTLTRKLGAKTCYNENQLHCDTDVQKEIANNLPRDTVAETIMEVSRYMGNSSDDENDENDEQAMNKDVNRDRLLGEKSPTPNHQLDRGQPYDSVTETIMEVSRCKSDIEEDTNEREKIISVKNVRTLYGSNRLNNEENMELNDKNDANRICQSVSPRILSPVQWDIEKTDKKTNTVRCVTGTESVSRSYDNSQNVQSHSPVSQSLFSPQHESHMSNLQFKEKEHVEENEEEEEVEEVEEEDEDEEEEEEEEEEEKLVTTNIDESQALVSLNTVPSSERSLVIKICNRNSQFSVTTTTASRQSEENNNAAEGSTSKEKMINNSEKEKVVGNQTNDLNDSDSDNEKLAVVDSNPEEDEEAVDGDEVEEIKNEENETIKVENQGNSETEIGTFAITEPNSDATEKLDNSAEIMENVANDVETKNHIIGDSSIPLAGEDTLCLDLNVEGTLDSMELEELLKRCIEVASPICVYCNHARHIAVNGKQLGLHMLAEHKFQPQHPAIIIHAEQFTVRVKRSLDDLQSYYFNLNTYNSESGTYNVPEVRTYECFHCRFYSAIHKDLYLHNRKMHQKTILICIMCKSSFYSYSELLCHLCPGIYSPNINLRYRCCLCSVTNIPSAFRLMVHLRKRHHDCDVCLESTGNQQRLSNHVWKHKLHHVCYRCDISYRNKPDITKHLFWKHGTESVLCRKCLQKKWPHIYHFCIPPTAFVCEECGSSFSRAVALKVHKRLHSGDFPHGCNECAERFISQKLLLKHQASHRQLESEDICVNVTDVIDPSSTNELNEKSDRDKDQRTTTTTNDNAPMETEIEVVKDVKEVVKRVVDVYDLPPLNLSSESDTDNEEEKNTSLEKSVSKEKDAEEDIANKNEITEKTVDVDDTNAVINDIDDVERNEEEKKQEARIMDGIWDNFKTYAASLEMNDSTKNLTLKESTPETDLAHLRNIILADHDYCVISSDKANNGDQATVSVDDTDTKERQDVKSCKSPSPDSPNQGCENDANKRTKIKTPKKKKQSGSTSSSDSSSDTDSSSCSCGTNCSCSSSSSGSSSSSSSSSDSDSSTSESPPKKKRKKEKEAENGRADSVEHEIEKEEIAAGKNSTELANEPAKPLLRESDLETEETDTDEDFYDEHPQLLTNKLLAEKRNLLLLAIEPASTQTSSSAALDQTSAPLNNGIPEVETTLSEPVTITINDQPQQKKKLKTKKRRKGEKDRCNIGARAITEESIKLNIPKTYYQKNPGFVASSPSLSRLHLGRSPNTLSTCNDLPQDTSDTMEIQQMSLATAPVTVRTNQNIVGNNLDTENKRFSKRKRVPKRFYGDSSDDEPQEKQQIVKWGRKTETAPSFAPSLPPLPLAVSTPAVVPKSLPLSRGSFGGKIIQGNKKTAQVEINQQALLTEPVLPIAPTYATESEGAVESSSESSESDAEDSFDQQKPYDDPPSVDHAPTPNRPPVKIYCYCRCPYDEVSEMIACDGQDCLIEWFHFECVGIMVPPKGKWYCPDCRKKHGIVQNDEYCD